MAIPTYDLPPMEWGTMGSETRNFRIMRIIDSRIVHIPEMSVLGVTVWWYHFDLQTGRKWIRPYEADE